MKNSLGEKSVELSLKRNLNIVNLCKSLEKKGMTKNKAVPFTDPLRIRKKLIASMLRIFSRRNYRCQGSAPDCIQAADGWDWKGRVRQPT